MELHLCSQFCLWQDGETKWRDFDKKRCTNQLSTHLSFLACALLPSCTPIFFFPFYFANASLHSCMHIFFFLLFFLATLWLTPSVGVVSPCHLFARAVRTKPMQTSPSHSLSALNLCKHHRDARCLHYTYANITESLAICTKPMRPS